MVTVTPATTQRIGFEPPLSAARRRWLARSPMGNAIKVHSRYERPFWRAVGSPAKSSPATSRPVGVVFDNSPAGGSSGVLVSFVYGDRYREYTALSPEQCSAAVLATLTLVFGAAAAEPRDRVEKLWPDDAWAEGGYAAVPTPGAWFAHGREGWRAYSGRIHWAGTEKATVWNGYLEGATRSSGAGSGGGARGTARCERPAPHDLTSRSSQPGR